MRAHTFSRAVAIAVATLLCFAPGIVQGQQGYVVKLVAEKKLTQLPTGALYWRLETFPTLAQAQAAEGPASLSGEAGGKFWLATLGAAGGSTPGGTKVTEIGPLPAVTATSYLLRMNDASGPPGSKTPVHMHPGSESFYVLSGQVTQRTTLGTTTIDAGGSMAGRAPGVAMEVSSSGSTDVHAVVLFLVDADKPFSSPASI
jgi:quercetin dioxygenase-like cupin family protein